MILEEDFYAKQKAILEVKRIGCSQPGYTGRVAFEPNLCSGVFTE
jgi:hypothetical protein